jgi:hypothetical protein
LTIAADAGAPLETSTRFDLTGSGMDGMVQMETGRLRMRPVQPRGLDSLTVLNGDPNKMKYISSPLSRHYVKEALDCMIEEWHRIHIWYAKLFLEPPPDWFDLFCLLQCWRRLGYQQFSLNAIRYDRCGCWP